MTLYEEISGYYDELFPLKKTRLDFVSSFLNGERLTVADTGCATGELALALSGSGHRVIGVDLNRPMVEWAREKAHKRGLSLKAAFLVKDMTVIGVDFPASSFDAVFCFGNTLVHLENPKKIEAFLSGVIRTLKDTGVFIVQIVNYDRMAAGEVGELPLIESENCAFRREYAFDKDAHLIHFSASLTIKETGTVRSSSQTLYPLTSLELRTALKNAGFAGIHFFGSESKEPFCRQSPALIAAARK